jgi:adenosylhomocysteine nucleosidase
MELCAGRWSGSGATGMSRIAIIAAMEREVAPLIRNWKVRTVGTTEHSGRRYRLFENGEATLVCGGIGGEAARRATEAVIREVNPERVISVGFAGALDASLQVGHVFEPRTVINAADGVRTECVGGEGILLSSATIASKEQKIRFGKAYGAVAVDMEAAAVAQGAQARGVEFGALKVISDAADFNLPPLDRFVAADGRFQSVRFACHVALRPWLWGATIALARNSAKASRALSDSLTSYLGRETRDREALPDKSLVAALNRTKDGPKSASGHTYVGPEVHTGAKQQQ